MIEDESQDHDGKNSPKHEEVREALLGLTHSEFTALPGAMQRVEDSDPRPIVAGWYLRVN